jgi:hypothetical protein
MVYVTGTVTSLVVPTTIALPLFTTTSAKTRSGVAAWAAGTASADRARAPETTAPMASFLMLFPTFRAGPWACAQNKDPLMA